jgi:hypothetical protein
MAGLNRHPFPEQIYSQTRRKRGRRIPSGWIACSSEGHDDQ